MFEFAELDYQETPLGAISLRRRSEPRLGGKVLYEVKLGEEFLMSSLFVEAEEELAALALQSLDAEELDVVVGGLGLGYTAAEALENEAVRSLLVIETMAPVISWHRLGLVPLGDKLALDSRCSLVHGDFFKLAASSGGFDPDNPGRLFHAVLLDIDHSPSHCWTRGIARSTPGLALLRWRPRCIPAVSSASGPTIRRMKRSAVCWTRYLHLQSFT
jgi:hypothetical protein